MATGRGQLAAMLAIAALAGCSGPFDADVRSIGKGFDTTDQVAGASAARPQADARGVIAYPNYQAALARRGDTTAAVAARVGVPADQLASYNGVAADAQLREGELLVIPGRGGGGGGSVAVGSGGTVDVAAVAGSALDRAGGVQTSSLPQPGGGAGAEPQRHRVAPGETAFSIARLYGVTPAALADWNGLGDSYTVRVGQVLLIPVAAAPAPARPPAAQVATATLPGAGSPTPVPPSAAKPLPLEEPAAEPISAPPKPAPEPAAPSSRLAMPASGGVIRAYAKGKNEGIDIAAPAGSPVKSAEKGTVAAITRDTEQVPIVVIRHEGNLLTVYAGVDKVAVQKGDSVSRGQQIAVVRSGSPAFLHFEVRDGFESVDPMPYLN